MMNLFNCYQALAFYTAVPFAIQWLANNGNSTWAILLGVGELVGFFALGAAVYEATK
jgi:uncharacterized membrane protein (DUF485 family)